MTNLWEIINAPDFKLINTKQGYHDFLKKRGALSKHSTNDKWAIRDPEKYKEWEKNIQEAMKLQKQDDKDGLSSLERSNVGEIKAEEIEI